MHRVPAALWVLALSAAGALAEPAGISGVSISFAGRELRVLARLQPGLPAEVASRLASGLPTTTVWRIGLFVFRDLWFDGKKEERRYEVTASYRPTTGDYAVERRLDDRLLETRVVPTREEAARALAEVPGLPCFLMGRHLLGKPLVVKVRCAYAPGVALGVVPTTGETGWVRSDAFEWSGSAADPR